jgi:hypothetical protein
MGVIPRDALVAPGGAAAFCTLRFRWNDPWTSLMNEFVTSEVNFRTAFVLE